MDEFSGSARSEAQELSEYQLLQENAASQEAALQKEYGAYGEGNER